MRPAYLCCAAMVYVSVAYHTVVITHNTAALTPWVHLSAGSGKSVLAYVLIHHPHGIRQLVTFWL